MSASETTSTDARQNTHFTAVILTHKRRGAVAVFPGEGPFAPRVLALLQNASPEDHATTLTGPDATIALGTEDTAEILRTLYERTLACAGATDAQVVHVALGVGPGSFTGLRLGCAFANGLLLGRSRSATALTCPPPTPDSPWHLPARDADDPFSAPVSFADVLSVCETLDATLDAGQANAVSEFVPAYGREPGPVIKLRSQGIPV